MTIRPPVPAIDVHTHVLPERLQAAIRRALTAMYGWSFDLPADPRAFAGFVRERGTERFCILPYAHKPGMARALNEWVAQTARSLPEAIGFACVNQDDDDPPGLLRDAFDAGLRGVKLHHQVQDVAPDDERLFPVYELMLERDLPLLVHAGRGPTDNGLVGAGRFSKLMARYPDLRICVAHMGAPERQEFVAMLPDYPKLYLDTSGIGGASLAGLGLDRLYGRLLFATDAPNIPGSYDDTITRITSLGLGADAERSIFRDNAIEFLRLQD